MAVLSKGADSIDFNVNSERHTLTQQLDVFETPGGTSSQTSTIGGYGTIRVIEVSGEIIETSKANLKSKLDILDNLSNKDGVTFTSKLKNGQTFTGACGRISYEASVNKDNIYSATIQFTFTEGASL